jgi:solute carrier family 25 (mitochondrial phosphate transporter), member 23/24/25/41
MRSPSPSTPTKMTFAASAFNTTNQPAAHNKWFDNLDDVALTGAEATEADPDITRALVVDEESLVVNEDVATPHDELVDSCKLLLSGGIAGALSKSCTAPLARLTILYQVDGLGHVATNTSQANKLGISEILKRIVRQEGLSALWKGNGVTIVHRLPYSAANFWTYEKVNELWKQHLPAQGPLAIGDVARRLVAGGIAGLSACTLAYPLDLVRTRLAAQTTHHYYHGISHTLSTIVKQDGLRGLYRGLAATLTQVAPSLAINYAAYETLRNQMLTIRNKSSSSNSNRNTPSVAMSLACGSVAGLISSTATFPLDLVRRRMQLGGGGGGAHQQQHGYIQMFRNVIQTGGVRGLYAGILPEYYKVVPGVAIAFCTYELMKASLDVQTNATSR